MENDVQNVSTIGWLNRFHGFTLMLAESGRLRRVCNKNKQSMSNVKSMHDMHSDSNHKRNNIQHIHITAMIFKRTSGKREPNKEENTLFVKGT